MAAREAVKVVVARAAEMRAAAVEAVHMCMWWRRRDGGG